MGPSVKRLRDAKDDIANVLASIERGEDDGFSPAGRDLVDELWQLEDSAWGPLLARLEDDELHGVLTRLRKVFLGERERRARFFSPIRQIHNRAFFDFSAQRLVVEMTFVKSEDESLEVRHDLEDTLRIGASIIEVVAGVMRTMNALSADAKRQCIGQKFKENLEQATAGVEEIKQMFDSVGSH